MRVSACRGCRRPPRRARPVRRRDEDTVTALWRASPFVSGGWERCRWGGENFDDDEASHSPGSMTETRLRGTCQVPQPRAKARSRHPSQAGMPRRYWLLPGQRDERRRCTRPFSCSRLGCVDGDDAKDVDGLVLQGLRRGAGVPDSGPHDSRGRPGDVRRVEPGYQSRTHGRRHDRGGAFQWPDRARRVGVVSSAWTRLCSREITITSIRLTSSKRPASWNAASHSSVRTTSWCRAAGSGWEHGLA